MLYGDIAGLYSESIDIYVMKSWGEQCLCLLSLLVDKVQSLDL